MHFNLRDVVIEWTEESGWMSRDPDALTFWKGLLRSRPRWAVTPTGPYVTPTDPLAIHGVVRAYPELGIEPTGDVPPVPELPEDVEG